MLKNVTLIHFKILSQTYIQFKVGNSITLYVMVCKLHQYSSFLNLATRLHKRKFLRLFTNSLDLNFI